MSDPWIRSATTLAGAVALLLMLTWLLPGASRAASDPRQFLDRFGRQATALLSDASLSQSRREQAFGALLKRIFDVPRIGRFVLGKHWHRTSD